MPLATVPPSVHPNNSSQIVNAPATSLLDELADIHLPDAIDAWPPAFGWWILLLAVLIAVFFIGKLILAWWQRYKYLSQIKKQANNELHQIKRHWQQQHNIVLSTAKLSTLLRRYLLIVFPREQIASMNTTSLLSLIEKHSKAKKLAYNYSVLLTDFPYQDPLICIDAEEKILINKQVDQFIAQFELLIKQGALIKNVLQQQKGQANV